MSHITKDGELMFFPAHEIYEWLGLLIYFLNRKMQRTCKTTRWKPVHLISSRLCYWLFFLFFFRCTVSTWISVKLGSRLLSVWRLVLFLMKQGTYEGFYFYFLQGRDMMKLSIEMLYSCDRYSFSCVLFNLLHNTINLFYQRKQKRRKFLA